MLDKVKRVEEAFSWRREPWIRSGETPEAKKNEINLAMNKLDLAARQLEDIWGEKFKEKIAVTHRLIVNLEVSVRNFDAEKQRREEGKEKGFSDEQLEQFGHDAIAPFQFDQTDPTRDEFLKATGEVREFLLGKLRHLGHIPSK